MPKAKRFFAEAPSSGEEGLGLPVSLLLGLVLALIRVAEVVTGYRLYNRGYWRKVKNSLHS